MYPKITRAEFDSLLARKTLKEVDLTELDLQAPPVDFSGVTIDSCTIQAMNLAGLKFRKATLKDCWCKQTNFSNADFTGAKLVGSWDSNFSAARFRGASLKKVSFEFATLGGTDFTDADLEKADSDAELASACFRGAKLSGADFGECSLDGCDFTGATLDGTKLKDADKDGAIGLSGAKKPAKQVKSTVYERAGAEGGPIVVVPASLASKWKGDAPDDFEDGVTVAGWVETGSIPFAKARVLVLAGELDTGFIPTADGGVFVRGGDFDDDLETAKKLVEKALKKKGWKAHKHAFVLTASNSYVFDATAKGAAKPEKIDSDYGVVVAPLNAGTYAVDVLGLEDDSGPVVFVRLRAT